MSKKRIIILIIFILLFFISIAYSVFYYSKRFVVKFETGTDEKILNQYLLRGEKIKKPETPKKEGYVFVEWDSNGENYDFNNKVKENIILSAKWIKEEYIKINFETNTLYELDSIKILKGEVLDELPNVIKEGYEFIGWYLKDELYDGRKLYSDTTLTAHFKEKEEEFKVGDIVYIVGPYSSSCMNNDYNVLAIGWDRVILDILEDSENPYVVGNENGVTGFFKANSLKK